MRTTTAERLPAASVSDTDSVQAPLELPIRSPRPITLEVPLARHEDVVDLSPDTETITELIRRAGPDEAAPARASAEVTTELDLAPATAPLELSFAEPEAPITDLVRLDVAAPEVEQVWLAEPGPELMSDEALRALVRRPRWPWLALAAAVLAVILTAGALPSSAPVGPAVDEEEELAPKPEPRSHVRASAPPVTLAAAVVRPSRAGAGAVALAKRSTTKAAPRARR